MLSFSYGQLLVMTKELLIIKISNDLFMDFWPLRLNTSFLIFSKMTLISQNRLHKCLNVTASFPKTKNRPCIIISSQTYIYTISRLPRPPQVFTFGILDQWKSNICVTSNGQCIVTHTLWLLHLNHPSEYKHTKSSGQLAKQHQGRNWAFDLLVLGNKPGTFMRTGRSNHQTTAQLLSFVIEDTVWRWILYMS